jgi:hypothetical protein
MLFFPLAIAVATKRQAEEISNSTLDADIQQVCLDDFLVFLLYENYRSVSIFLYFFFFCRLIGILFFEIGLSAHFAKLRTLLSLKYPLLLGSEDKLALGKMLDPRIGLILFNRPDDDSQNVKIRSCFRFIN